MHDPEQSRFFVMEGKEIWKGIYGYTGKYQISTFGRIKSLNYRRTGNERVMSTPLNSRGYPSVRLSENGNVITRTVHQLMAVAFLNHKPCGYKMIVHHIDGNKENNHKSNLRLTTQRENISFKRGTSKYTGVSWDSHAKKWKSGAMLEGKVKHLGLFNNEIDAHKAYLKAIGLPYIMPNVYSNNALMSRNNHMVFCNNL